MDPLNPFPAPTEQIFSGKQPVAASTKTLEKLETTMILFGPVKMHNQGPKTDLFNQFL